MPPNYFNGKIYKITADGFPDLIYYGATTQTLSKRLTGHVSEMKKWEKNQTHYCTSFQIIEKGKGVYHITLLENYPCNNKDELGMRERFYIENNECVNKCIPTRTQTEWTEDHKEELRKYHKLYRQEHVDELKERGKLYREVNKDKLKDKKSQYHEANRDVISEKHKLYYEANKEAFSDKFKKYYEANKEVITEYKKSWNADNRDRISEYRSKLVLCETCNCEVSLQGLSQHNKTKKHLKNSGGVMI